MKSLIIALSLMLASAGVALAQNCAPDSPTQCQWVGQFWVCQCSFLGW